MDEPDRRHRRHPFGVESVNTDVIIIGGGPSGLSLAAVLGAAGA